MNNLKAIAEALTGAVMKIKAPTESSNALTIKTRSNECSRGYNVRKISSLKHRSIHRFLCLDLFCLSIEQRKKFNTWKNWDRGHTKKNDMTHIKLLTTACLSIALLSACSPSQDKAKQQTDQPQAELDRQTQKFMQTDLSETLPEDEMPSSSATAM